MAKYRKKPIEVEAFRFGYENNPEWINEAIDKNHFLDYGKYAKIVTLEGVMFAERGDFIIKGIAGELYPCRFDIFCETYDIVEESEDTE
jgi:hypothetical protein